MTYEEAKQTRDELFALLDMLAAPLKDAPKGEMGLTLDSAKTPEWRAAHASYWDARKRVGKFMQVFQRTFKKEIRAEHAARRSR